MMKSNDERNKQQNKIQQMFALFSFAEQNIEMIFVWALFTGCCVPFRKSQNSFCYWSIRRFFVLFFFFHFSKDVKVVPKVRIYFNHKLSRKETSYFWIVAQDKFKPKIEQKKKQKKIESPRIPRISCNILYTITYIFTI